jgi:SAM-dependent methyltransferase
MSEHWRLSAQRSQEFDAAAVAYDRYRPRYPEGLFDDIVELGELKPGASAIEIGAGTGIATGPLISRGLQVMAIEPAPAMASIANEKFGSNARFVHGRFEDWPPTERTELIAAFNAWHWVEPDKGVSLAAQLLSPGGSLALVWTDVVSWGEDGFEARLAEATGRLGQSVLNTYWLHCSPSAPVSTSMTSGCTITGSSAGWTRCRSLLSPEPTAVTTPSSVTRSFAGSSKTSSKER